MIISVDETKRENKSFELLPNARIGQRRWTDDLSARLDFIRSNEGQDGKLSCSSLANTKKFAGPYPREGKSIVANDHEKSCFGKTESVKVHPRESFETAKDYEKRYTIYNERAFMQKVRDGWIEFIKEIDRRNNIDWYATLTFREWVHPESAKKMFDMWIHEINRKKFGRRYWKHNNSITGVVALEYQARSVIHFHALLATGGMRRLTFMDRWNELAGIARIYPFRRNGGAEAYVSKYVVKGGEVDVVGYVKGLTQRQVLS